MLEDCPWTDQKGVEGYSFDEEVREFFSTIALESKLPSSEFDELTTDEETKDL